MPVNLRLDSFDESDAACGGVADQYYTVPWTYRFVAQLKATDVTHAEFFATGDTTEHLGRRKH